MYTFCQNSLSFLVFHAFANSNFVVFVKRVSKRVEITLKGNHEICTNDSQYCICIC